MLHRTAKRFIDVAGAAIGIAAIAPLAPLIAAAIAFESRGPVIVRLDRVSQGKTIRVYKFRSMVLGAEGLKPSLGHLNERLDGPFFKIKKDPRITKVGLFLRKFRLD